MNPGVFTATLTVVNANKSVSSSSIEISAQSDYIAPREKAPRPLQQIITRPVNKLVALKKKEMIAQNVDPVDIQIATSPKYINRDEFNVAKARIANNPAKLPIVNPAPPRLKTETKTALLKPFTAGSKKTVNILYSSNRN
jgi:hypothetical protein